MAKIRDSALLKNLTTPRERIPRPAVLLLAIPWLVCGNTANRFVAGQERARAASSVTAEGDRPTHSDAEVQGFELTFPAIGTLVSFKAFHHDRETVDRAFQAARKEVVRVGQLLSDYDPESETRQLSEREAKSQTVVSDELWEVLEASDRWYVRSAGAFDSSLGQVTRLWRKYRRSRRGAPSADQIEDAISKSGWSNVELCHDEQAVRINQDDVRLDFGAIGKGYLADMAFDILQTHGVESCLVNISGNMRIGSAPPDRDGWRIEVAALEKGGAPLQKLVLADVAVATSGDLWQFMVIDGVRRSHIIDPRTGWGVAGPVAATVLATTAMDADAMATAACIMQKEKAFALANKLDLQLLLAKRGEDDSVLVVRSDQFPKP